jgi:pimeloyl-ACP methyl ester carboxylesterase
MRHVPRLASTISTACMIALAAGCTDSSIDGSHALSTEPSVVRVRDVAILTTDHYVPHISTVHANLGEPVTLFVRERVATDHHGDRLGNRPGGRPVVLMIQGATSPTLPTFDLAFEDYSWMAFLARAGFDVFTMDLQGYGLSARPKMDDPCNTQSTQQALLIPKTLAAPCPPSYPFRMTIQSDWDEIDSVVDYVRNLRGVERVSLIGWSRGGLRVGSYAARFPEKVDKLFLYAPAMYNRTGPSDPPANLPQPLSLMQLGSIATFTSNWDGQVRCADQVNPAIRPVLNSAILANDPVGSTWGNGRLWRAPLQNTHWGWNSAAAGRIDAPTLIIRGEFDSQAPEPLQRDLFVDLGTKHKVFVRVACASHQLVWENQHIVLLRASEEWLRHGGFAGHHHGSFFVDTEGRVRSE